MVLMNLTPLPGIPGTRYQLSNAGTLGRWDAGTLGRGTLQKISSLVCVSSAPWFPLHYISLL